MYVTETTEDNDIHQLHSNFNDGSSSKKKKKYFCIYHIHRLQVKNRVDIYVDRFAKNIFPMPFSSPKFSSNLLQKKKEKTQNKTKQTKKKRINFYFIISNLRQTKKIE